MSAGATTIRTDLGSDAKSMARGASVNLLGILAANVLGFVFTVTVTHLVDARAVGLVALGSTIVGFAVIPSLLGLDTGIIRFVARAASLDDERAARASLQAGLAVVCLISIALTAAIWVLAPTISDHFFHKPGSTDILRIVALSLPAMALGRAVMAAVQGYGVMRYSAWLGIVRRVIQIAALIPLIVVGLDARTLALAGVVSAWGSLRLAFDYLSSVHPNSLRPARGSWPWLSLLNFSAPQVLTGLLFFAILWTDTLLLGRYRTAAEVGVYSVLGTLLGPAVLVSTAVGQMFAPRIAAEDARGDRRTLATMLKRVTHWNTAISIPFFTALAVVPGALLSLFGHTYRSGAHALAILAIGQLLNTAAGPLGQVLNMSGRQYLTMTNNGVVAGLNAVGCVFLIPRYGMTGAACSTSASLTIVNLIKLVEVQILFRMHPFRWQTLRLFGAAAVAALLALPLAVFPHWPAGLLEALVAGTLVFIAYLFVVLRVGMTDEDKELFALGRARLTRIGRLRSLPSG